jgi:hypothetical protein
MNDRRSIGRTKIAQGALLFFSGQTGVRSCCVTDITNVGGGIHVRDIAVLPPWPGFASVDWVSDLDSDPIGPASDLDFDSAGRLGSDR